MTLPLFCVRLEWKLTYDLMTIKLILLKSGEDLISDIHEMIVGEEPQQRVVGYYLNKPCLIKLTSKGFPEQNSEKESIQVSLYPWMPLSLDETIPIPSDWIVTIVEPIEKVKNLYLADVVKNGKQTNQSSDSSDSSEADHRD